MFFRAVAFLAIYILALNFLLYLHKHGYVSLDAPSTVSDAAPPQTEASDPAPFQQLDGFKDSVVTTSADFNAGPANIRVARGCDDFKDESARHACQDKKMQLAYILEGKLELENDQFDAAIADFEAADKISLMCSPDQMESCDD